MVSLHLTAAEFRLLSQFQGNYLQVYPIYLQKYRFLIFLQCLELLLLETIEADFVAFSVISVPDRFHYSMNMNLDCFLLVLLDLTISVFSWSWLKASLGRIRLP